MSYGFGPYGLTPYGGGDGDSGFNLVSAVPVDFRTVDLTFSSELDANAANIALLSSGGAYSITPGLPVLAAILLEPDVIRVFTLPMNGGVVYQIEILADLRDIYDQSLTVRTATFTALSAPRKYVVSGLEARTLCEGKSIYLRWTNPVTPAPPDLVKIVRRLKAWPFDLTDEHEVVYEGEAIEEFTDTGIVMPITYVGASAAIGATSIQVESSVDYTVGDRVRIEKLTGPKTFDIVIVSAIPDATHLVFDNTHLDPVSGLTVFDTPLVNAYAEDDRVAKATELQAQTYYYYLVLAHEGAPPEPEPTEYDWAGTASDGVEDPPPESGHRNEIVYEPAYTMEVDRTVTSFSVTLAGDPIEGAGALLLFELGRVGEDGYFYVFAIITYEEGGTGIQTVETDFDLAEGERLRLRSWGTGGDITNPPHTFTATATTVPA